MVLTLSYEVRAIVRLFGVFGVSCAVVLVVGDKRLLVRYFGLEAI